MWNVSEKQMSFKLYLLVIFVNTLGNPLLFKIKITIEIDQNDLDIYFIILII